MVIFEKKKLSFVGLTASKLFVRKHALLSESISTIDWRHNHTLALFINDQCATDICTAINYRATLQWPWIASIWPTFGANIVWKRLFNTANKHTHRYLSLSKPFVDSVTLCRRRQMSATVSYVSISMNLPICTNYFIVFVLYGVMWDKNIHTFRSYHWHRARVRQWGSAQKTQIAGAVACDSSRQWHSWRQPTRADRLLCCLNRIPLTLHLQQHLPTYRRQRVLHQCYRGSLLWPSAPWCFSARALPSQSASPVAALARPMTILSMLAQRRCAQHVWSPIVTLCLFSYTFFFIKLSRHSIWKSAIETCRGARQ